MLEVKNLTVYFDTAMALNNVSIKVKDGEIVGIVGPNGAGKTTLLNVISGLLLWEKSVAKLVGKDIIIDGEVMLDGKKISSLQPYERVKLGIVHCPERRRMFLEMSVTENLLIGAYHRKDKDKLKQELEWIFKMFPEVERRKNELAGNLSGGEQQMVAIGRALLSKPKILLVDEPTMGLSPRLRNTLYRCLREINEKMGVTIVIAEQDVNFTFNLSQRNYVISHGKIIKEGLKEELLNDEELRKAYLGI